MIKTSIKFNPKVPEINLREELEVIAREIFIPRMQQYIHNQVDIKGRRYPDLEPQTIAIKKGQIYRKNFTKSGNLRAGVSDKISKTGLSSFSSKTLIDTGKLLTSFIYKNLGKKSLYITLKINRLQIGKFLQIDGVGNKKKKFLFFGVSRQMEKEAMNYMKARIKEAINATRRK